MVIRTHPNNLLATLAAAGGKVGSITVLTVQLAYKIVLMRLKGQ